MRFMMTPLIWMPFAMATGDAKVEYRGIHADNILSFSKWDVVRSGRG